MRPLNTIQRVIIIHIMSFYNCVVHLVPCVHGVVPGVLIPMHTVLSIGCRGMDTSPTPPRPPVRMWCHAGTVLAQSVGGLGTVAMAGGFLQLGTTLGYDVVFFGLAVLNLILSIVLMFWIQETLHSAAPTPPQTAKVLSGAEPSSHQSVAADGANNNPADGVLSVSAADSEDLRLSQALRISVGNASGAQSTIAALRSRVASLEGELSQAQTREQG